MHAFFFKQRSTVLGNKIEMEITELVEKNTSLLRLGLHLEYNDARHRVAAHLQRNIDRSKFCKKNVFNILLFNIFLFKTLQVLEILKLQLRVPGKTMSTLNN